VSEREDAEEVERKEKPRMRETSKKQSNKEKLQILEMKKT
jgi:hypothetical protein